ncbi:hypothetical protein [Derxia gummosa]|uniref:Uncharacterized protein n=1 Tax=Derxia gummosa DSM 723 TaxID=1121388 RepID=A0A8B6X8S8_9BURK|nr:hypothetical protein [Derxia gummosa]
MPESTPRRSVAVIAVLAFALACAAHELLGHGAACAASGGTIVELNSVRFRCAGGGLAADLGGPLANAWVGLGGLGLLRVRRWSPAATLALELGVAFNLLWIAGCLLWSAIAGRSDFAFAIRMAADGAPGARGLLALAGVMLGRFTLRRLTLSRAMARLAWLAAGTACCVSVLLCAGPLLPLLREAALEGFGAMAWLLFVPARGGPAAPGRHAVPS